MFVFAQKFGAVGQILKKISVVVEFIDDVVCFVEQRVEIAVGSTLTGQSIDHGLE